MKTSVLAWLMLCVGIVGLLLLGGSLLLWSRLDLAVETDKEQLLRFIGLLVSGSFLVGLCQAWFALFSSWSEHILGQTKSRSRPGRVLGVVGFVSIVGLVLLVFGAGARLLEGSLTAPALVTVVLLQAVLLLLEARWVQSFAVRTAAAEEASV